MINLMDFQPENKKDLFQQLLQNYQIEEQESISSIQQQQNTNTKKNNHKRAQQRNNSSTPEMPFKKNIQVLLTCLRKKIQGKQFLPKYFRQIFNQKVRIILTGVQNNRNKDMSLFVELWILIKQLSKQYPQIQIKALQIIEEIVGDHQKCHKGKKKIIRLQAKRILQCVNSYQENDNFQLFLKQLWGPQIKKIDFNNFVNRAEKIKEAITEWIRSNMKIIQMLKLEKE